MSNNSLFKSAKSGIYQRIRYPHLVTIIPLKSCLQDLDLLSSSIVYSLTTPYKRRLNDETFYWNLLSRFICNEEDNFISLVFKSPNNLKDLRVTYINNVDELKLFPSLKDKVLSDLIYISRS